MKSKPYFIIYLAMFAVLLWFDRFTKNLVMTNMQVGDAIPSAESFFSIRYTLNTGVSFSMLEGHTELLIVIQIVLIVVVTVACVFTYVKLRHPVLQTGLCWIVSGGAGNLVDRVTYGHVVDFISVGTFPVWNFADMCVVGGCILIAIYILRVHSKHERDGSGDGSFYVSEEEHERDGSFSVSEEEHERDGSFYVSEEDDSPTKLTDTAPSDE